MKRILLIAITTLLFPAVHAQNCISNTGSVEFTGTSTYVEFMTDNNLDITDSMTIEAWVYSNAWGFSSAQNTIVCNHGWFSGEAGYVFRAGGTGELSFNFAGDSSGTTGWRDLVSTPAVLQLNTWHHVAATVTSSESKLYVDGILVGSRTFSPPVALIPSPNYIMNIGRLADDNQFETRYWDGLIDEVRIWHRVLDATELTQNMMNHIDTTTAIDLVGYWRFNEASANVAGDWSPSNNDGIITSGTWSTNVPFGAGPPMPTITQAPPYLFSSATSGNQWNLNGAPIANATGTGYQPLQNGDYTVTVTDSNGCSATSAIVTVTTLGISEMQSSGLLKQSGDIRDRLHFILPDAMLISSELRIYDNVGKEVMNLSKGNVTSEVNIDLSPGVYLVYLNTGTSRYSEKIIVH